jgi:hypothetical protein
MVLPLLRPLAVIQTLIAASIAAAAAEHEGAGIHNMCTLPLLPRPGCHQ